MTKQKRWHWQCDGEMSPHCLHQHHWWPAGCHDGSFSLVTHRDQRHCCSYTGGGVITASSAFHFHSVTQPGEDPGIKSQASLHGDRNVVTEQIYLHGSALWLVRGAQVVPRTGSHWLGGSRDWDQWRCWAGISSEKYESQAAALSWAGAAPGAVARPGPTARQSTYVVPLLEHYSQHNANWFKV